MVHTLSERGGLTTEHAREWLKHVGVARPVEEVEGDEAIVAATRAVLEEGVHQLADSVRNSLNFYRTQEASERVERGVVTGPIVEIPGFVERLAAELRLPLEHARRRGRRRAGLAGAADRRGRPRGGSAPVAGRRPPRYGGMTVAAGAVLAGAFGLAFGSFLNVVAHRLPRRESLSQAALALPALR